MRAPILLHLSTHTPLPPSRSSLASATRLPQEDGALLPLKALTDSAQGLSLPHCQLDYFALAWKGKGSLIYVSPGGDPLEPGSGCNVLRGRYGIGLGSFPTTTT